MNALAILPITFSANGETIVFHARKSQQRARILEYRAGVLYAHGKPLRANSLGGPTHRSTARTAKSIKLTDATSALNRSPASSCELFGMQAGGRSFVREFPYELPGVG